MRTSSTGCSPPPPLGIFDLRPKDPNSPLPLCVIKESYFTQLWVGVGLDAPSFGRARWVMSEDVNIKHLLDIPTFTDINSNDISYLLGRAMGLRAWIWIWYEENSLGRRSARLCALPMFIGGLGALTPPTKISLLTNRKPHTNFILCLGRRSLEKLFRRMLSNHRPRSWTDDPFLNITFLIAAAPTPAALLPSPSGALRHTGSLPSCHVPPYPAFVFDADTTSWVNVASLWCDILISDTVDHP